LAFSEAGLLGTERIRLFIFHNKRDATTGVRPEKMDWMFRYYHSVGFSTGKIEVYLGRELTPVSLPPGDGEEFIERVEMPFDTLYQMAVSGQVMDSKTMLAVLWYSHRIRKTPPSGDGG
jgi:hypothetical protein